jgi:hypothetical protein
MKTITISAMFVLLTMATFSQNICPSSLKRNNGNGGTCSSLGELRLNFPSVCPTTAPIIDSVLIDGVKSNVTFNLPETSHCGGPNGYISYCVTSGNMPPTNFWTIFFHVDADSYSCTVSTTTTGTLAVKYYSFDAFLSGSTVTCNWVTEQEINNNYFELERSFDGINYATAAIIFSAESNSGTTESYTYKDNAAVLQNNSIVYYRIKQVDKDGGASYSKVITVRLKANAVSNLQLSPNPFNEKLTIKIDAVDNALATTKIINTTGQTVATSQSAVSKGFNNLQIGNLNALSKGIYVVQVSLNGVVTGNQKVIKN